MVRLGAGLVGIDPSETVELHGASRLTAPIVHSATVEAGTPVGYGGTYVTDASTNLSVLPLGYADGIPREISPGRRRGDPRAPPPGRRPGLDGPDRDRHRRRLRSAVGTTATVFGPQDGVTPTIHDWARWAGTIPAHHRHRHRTTSEKDNRMTRHVLVIGGGQNAEHDVSLATAAAIDGRAALPRVRRSAADHRPRRAVETRAGPLGTQRRRLAGRGAAAPRTADVVFPAVHGPARGGRDARGAVRPRTETRGRLRPAGRGDRHGQVGDQARRRGHRDPHRPRTPGDGGRRGRHRIRDRGGRQAGLGRVQLRRHPGPRRRPAAATRCAPPRATTTGS